MKQLWQNNTTNPTLYLPNQTRADSKITSPNNYNKYEPSLASTNEHMSLKEYIYQSFLFY
jgi:hypothetical protein